MFSLVQLIRFPKRQLFSWSYIRFKDFDGEGKTYGRHHAAKILYDFINKILLTLISYADHFLSLSKVTIIKV